MAVFSGVSTMRQESEQSMWEGSVPGDTAEGPRAAVDTRDGAPVKG